MAWPRRILRAVLTFPICLLLGTLSSSPVLAEHATIFVDKLSRSTVCDELPAPRVSCELITRYTFTLPSDEAPAPHILVISGFRGDLEVRLNNRQLTAPFSTRTDQLIRGGPPIQIPLLAEQLKSGFNDLVVAINSEAVMGPYPGTVAIFAENHGGDEYTHSLWNSILLARMADGIVFALCLIAVGISMVAKRPHVYLCFAVVCLCWLMGSLVTILPKSFPTSIATALNLTSLIGGMLWTPLLLMIANYAVPRWLWGVCFTVPALLYAVTWTVGDQLIVRGVTAAALLLVFLMALYALILIIRRGRSYLVSNAIWLSLALFVIVMGLSRISSAVTVEGLFPPVRSVVFFLAVIAIGVALVRRFLSDFVDAKAQEEKLRFAVDAAELEILKQVEANQKQQSIIVKQAERQRLMGDLHDGVAGHLLTISALARPGNTAPDLSEIRQISQAAIVDLRLIVDSLDEQARTLKDCISGFQARALQFTQSAGFAFHCGIDAGMPDYPVSQSVALDLVRILQELINNAIRHSGGSEIALRVVAESEGTVVIRVVDNGTEAPANLNGKPGVGVRSMHRRAERIGGELRLLQSESGGVLAELVLNPSVLDVGPY